MQQWVGRFEMLGIVVMVRCEKPYRENSTYDMLVALPMLQELISLPNPEDVELVKSTLKPRSTLRACH
jgi:hypothetical protein